MSRYPQISKNFHAQEFACKCKARGVDCDDTFCHGAEWIDERLVIRLQTLRDRIKRPIIVTSGCRCPAYNRHVGGAPGSQHIRGKAADIQVAGMTPYDLAKICTGDLFPSVATYPTFVHVDIREASPWRSIDKTHNRPMRNA